MLLRRHRHRDAARAGAAFFSFAGVLIRDLWVLGDLAGVRTQLDAATRAT